MADQPPHRPPPPHRPERPVYAPVVFDDDDGPRGGRGGPEAPNGGPSDSTLLRLLAVIAGLGILIIALVLPWSPISVVGGDGDQDAGTGDFPASARDLPETPEGLVGLSKLYEIGTPEGFEGSGPWTLTVSLEEPTTDDDQLAFYSYDGGRWQRLASVRTVEDGASARGDVSEVPGTIAVMRRTALARSLGLIVDAGDAPDTTALGGASIVSVMAAQLAEDGGTDGVIVENDALEEARGAITEAGVYLGVGAPDDPAALDAVIAAPERAAAHADGIAQAAEAEQAAGVHLDYVDLASVDRDAFTAFVQSLADGLAESDRGLVVSVPTPTTTDTGAYDWGALLDTADALWLRPPADRSVFYQQLEPLLAAQREAGVDLGRVSLVLDRQSRERSGNGIEAITLRDALVRASEIDRQMEGGVDPGDGVTLRGAHIDPESQGSGLRWDDDHRTVTFSYGDADGQHTVWLENRYSAAFRLDLAARFDLGGVVVASAGDDAELPDVWEPVVAFIEEGQVRLERPYGPYLSACWQAVAGAIEGAAGECWTEEGEATANGSVVWRAPDQSGIYDVRLIVSDGTVFVGQQIALRVASEEERADPTPTPEQTETPDAEATETPDPEPEETETAEPTQPAEPTEEPTATEEPTEAPSTPEAPETPTAPDEPDGPPGPGGNEP